MNAPLALLAFVVVAVAAMASPPLPFERAAINRYSVDGIPRSLSIRQGADVWLAYDLERASVFKVWQARPGQPGLVASDFTVKASGTVWFHDRTASAWELVRDGLPVPLKIRYLGCTQRADAFELSWELRHDSGALVLHERVPRAALAAGERVRRELRAEPLAGGEVLRPPGSVREAWRVGGEIGADWRVFLLP